MSGLDHVAVAAMGYTPTPVIPCTKSPLLPNWPRYIPEGDDLKRWASGGFSTGIIVGSDLVALDADALDIKHASIINHTVEVLAGKGPVRIGKSPKALYLFRANRNLITRRIPFDGGEIDVMRGPRQFVAAGIHPDTKQPYTWPRPLKAKADLPELTQEMFDAIAAELEKTLPNTRRSADKSLNDGAISVPQDLLRGDVKVVRSAMKAMPNGADVDRDAWIRVMLGLRGALQDDPEEAFALWEEWSERWDGEAKGHDYLKKTWDSFHAPWGLGYREICERAEKATGGAWTPAGVWFDDLGEAPRGETEREDDAARETAIAWLDPGDWHGVAPAAREWEVAGWIPRHEVTLLYGDGGIGKTLLIHQYATAAAAGVPWLGQATRPARVMCFFCEDDARELHRRQIDINKALGVEMTDLGGLRIASRKYGDNLLALWDRNTGAMKRQAIWEKLRADALAFGADVVVVDTLADTYGGSEIDRSQVNAFVKSCLGRLAAAIGGSVIALGHPSLAGKASGSGTSGSTAWSNAARSRLFLRYPKGVESGDVRELEGMKSNYGPKGALLKLRWQSGAFAMLASNMPGVSGRQNAAQKTAGGLGERLGYARGSVDAAALDAVGAALEFCAGVPMNMSPKSPRYAARVLRSRCSDMTGMLGDAEIVNALNRLDGSGHLQVSKLGLDASRKPIFGLRVSDELSESENDESDLFG